MNSSPMHMMSQMVKSMGGDFKILGNQAIAFGKDERIAGTVEADWGINLISWRIKPFIGRPQYAASSSNFFDIAGGSWMDTVKNIAGSTPFGGAKAIAGIPAAVPNRQTGDNINGGAGQDSQASRGKGWVVLNGEPNAKAGGSIIILGARPGVDGTYRITEAEHSYSRRGYTTRCDVDQPQLDASVYAKMGFPETNTPPSPPLPPPLEPERPPEEQSEGAGAGGITFPSESQGTVEIGPLEILPSR
jgi:hypothetical protein